MKIGSLLNEIFDTSSLKQPAAIQKSVENLNKFINRNPDLGKDVAGDVANINTSFASLLAQIQAQNAAALEEKKKKDMEQKMAMQQQNKQRVGVGSTIPIKPANSGNSPTNTKSY